MKRRSREEGGEERKEGRKEKGKTEKVYEFLYFIQF